MKDLVQFFVVAAIVAVIGLAFYHGSNSHLKKEIGEANYNILEECRMTHQEKNGIYFTGAVRLCYKRGLVRAYRAYHPWPSYWWL